MTTTNTLAAEYRAGYLGRAPDIRDQYIAALEAQAEAKPAPAVQVVVDHERIKIKRGVQTFELAYEADTDGERQWYAKQLRTALAAPAAPAPHADTKDAERIQHFEDMANKGFCPSLVFDDDGHWAVSYSGAAPVPEPEGHEETVYVTVEVEPNLWRHSVREAIDAAIAASKGEQA